MLRFFKDHPRSVGETYGQHMKFALCCGFSLVKAGICCSIHAFFPFIFKTRAADAVAKMAAKFMADDRNDYFMKRLHQEQTERNRRSNYTSSQD